MRASCGVEADWIPGGLTAFASSAPSNLVPDLMVHFAISEEVAILSISLFVAGYCFGPLVSPDFVLALLGGLESSELTARACGLQIWGPLSERYGRRFVFVVSFVPYILFQMACALAPNTGALLVFRFLGGWFAAAPLTNVSLLPCPSFECVVVTDGCMLFPFTRRWQA